MTIQVKNRMDIRSSALTPSDSGAKKLDKAVCWHEGMLLSPHHFQQNQNYWEQQFYGLTKKLFPHYWGVSELVVDHGALVEGEVKIERLLAVMPDGLLVDYDAVTDTPLTIQLDEIEDNGVVTVQITVPIKVAGSANERSEIQRYRSCNGEQVVDENTGENELVIHRLLPDFTLQIADKVSSRFVSFPLFRVIKSAEGTFQINPSYCPPLLSIGADKFRDSANEGQRVRSLQKSCQDLAIAMRLKVHKLAGLDGDGGRLGSNISMRHHRWIRALGQGLASFEYLADDSRCKPSELYLELIRIAGLVSELDPNYIPPKFPRYVHDNALVGFQRLIEYISAQVERVNLRYTTLSFDEDAPGVFSLYFDKAWSDKDLLIELRPAKGSHREDLINWMESCRIASLSLHKELRERRILGAKTVQIEKDENSEIVPGNGNLLFRIKANRQFIFPGTKLAIISSNKTYKAYAPTSIFLHMPHD